MRIVTPRHSRCIRRKALLDERASVIEQNSEASTVDSLFDLLLCFPCDPYLLHAVAERVAQHAPSQREVKLTQLELFGHHSLLSNRLVPHVALGKKTWALLQAQVHKGEVDHDLARLDLRQWSFYLFESRHRAILLPHRRHRTS